MTRPSFTARAAYIVFSKRLVERYGGTSATQRGIASALSSAYAEGVEASAQVAQDYREWSDNWGEDRNRNAAEVAAQEIAAAIRKLKDQP